MHSIWGERTWIITLPGDKRIGNIVQTCKTRLSKSHSISTSKQSQCTQMLNMDNAMQRTQRNDIRTIEVPMLFSTKEQ